MTSVLIVSKYSGRPDPSYPLVDYLKDEETKQKLMAIGERVLKAPLALEIQIQRMSKLGYRGIIIDDREGLVFVKGTRMQIFEKQVLAYLKNVKKPVWLELDEPVAIERAFAAKETP